MFDISKIDKNFEINSNNEKKDLVFRNADSIPFNIYGVFKENGKYRRLPEKVAKTVSKGVYTLHTHTAGGRVKFITDSPYIIIKSKMDGLGRMSHFPLSGSIGFDMYVNNRYVKTFLPPYGITDGYESVFEFGDNEEREVTINFPLYSNVDELYIGLSKNAVLRESSPYVNSNPVVYYGSSITQGGCASRPGMSYEAIVSREFNIDYVNLGFSGNAKAENEIIDYVKNLNMSAFVYDYDYNAPSVEHLRETHKKMFKAIRKKHPDIPIIIMSRPKYYLSDEEKIKRDIIEATYNSAVDSGDENVYFLDGAALTRLCKDSGTVDNIHPTDFGFASMAEALIKVIKENDIILNLK